MNRRDRSFQDNIFNSGWVRLANGMTAIDLNVDMKAVVSEYNMTDRAFTCTKTDELAWIGKLGLMAIVHNHHEHVLTIMIF